MYTCSFILMNAEIYLPIEESEDTKIIIRILKYIYLIMQLTKRTQKYIYDNHNPNIEEAQTTHWPSKVQKGKRDLQNTHVKQKI